MEHQVVEHLPVARAGAVDESEVAARVHHAAVLVQFGEVLARGGFRGIGHGHGQEAFGLQQGEDVGEGLVGG